MKYSILEQTEHSLKAEFQVPPAWLVNNQRKITHFFRSKKKELPQGLLTKEIRRVSIQQTFKAFKKERSFSEWRAPNYEVLLENPGKNLKFQATFSLMPAVSLPDYKKLEVEVPPVPMPKDTDLMARLLDLQYYLADFTPVERPAQKGDQIYLDLIAGTPDGFTLPLTAENNIELWLTSTVPDGLLQGLIGLNAGDTKEIKTTLPEDYHLKEYQGKECVYRVQVRSVNQVTLPPIDAAFLEEVSNAQNLEELMDELYQDKVEDNQDTWLTSIKQQIVNHLSVLSAPDIPKEMVLAEMLSRWEKDEKPKLEALLLPESLINESQEFWLNFDEIYEDALIKLTQNLVLTQLITQEDLDLGSDDLLLTLKSMADNFEVKVEDLYTEMQSSGQLELLAHQLLLEKAVDFLYDNTRLLCEGEIIKD